MTHLQEYDLLKKIPPHKNMILLHKLYLFERANDKVVPVLKYDLAVKSLDDEIIESKQNQNTLNKQAIQKIIQDLSEGLSYLHSFSIFHFDIKPANILKSAKGDYMLADFG